MPGDIRKRRSGWGFRSLRAFSADSFLRDVAEFHGSSGKSQAHLCGGAPGRFALVGRNEYCPKIRHHGKESLVNHQVTYDYIPCWKVPKEAWIGTPPVRFFGVYQDLILEGFKSFYLIAFGWPIQSKAPRSPPHIRFPAAEMKQFWIIWIWRGGLILKSPKGPIDIGDLGSSTYLEPSKGAPVLLLGWWIPSTRQAKTMLLARAGTIFSSTATANVFYGSVDFLIFFEKYASEKVMSSCKASCFWSFMLMVLMEYDGWNGALDWAG